jgi:hypothetical protein
MKPESDSSAALTVSRGFTSSISATAGVRASQTPLGNVSLDLTRSRLTSWNLSAHRVVSGEFTVYMYSLYMYDVINLGKMAHGANHGYTVY